MKTIKIILIFLGVFAIFLISEGVYIFSHRDVLSSYILKSSELISEKGNIGLAFFVLTEGGAKLPDDSNFKNKVGNYLASVPHNYNLPRVMYDLTIVASKDGLSNLVPILLGISIERDPDFSFWRVELANYYLSLGKTQIAEKVLDDCMVLPAPRQYCSNYKNGDFVNNIVHPVGFLTSSIDTFY